MFCDTSQWKWIWFGLILFDRRLKEVKHANFFLVCWRDNSWIEIVKLSLKKWKKFAIATLVLEFVFVWNLLNYLKMSVQCNGKNVVAITFSCKPHNWPQRDSCLRRAFSISNCECISFPANWNFFLKNNNSRNSSKNKIKMRLKWRDGMRAFHWRHQKREGTAATSLSFQNVKFCNF